MLDAVLIDALSPIEAVKERGEERWRVLGQLLFNVGVPDKELVRAGVQRSRSIRMVNRSLIIASAPSRAPLITRGRSRDHSVDGERHEKQAHLAALPSADE